MSSLEHRTPKGPARLEALSGTASDMFLDRGFEAVSLDEIIGRAGGSRRTIYQHFGGKEGLFVAAIETFLRGQASGPIDSGVEPK